MAEELRLITAPPDIDVSVAAELGADVICDLDLGATREALAEASGSLPAIVDELIGLVRSDGLALLVGAPVEADETLMLICHHIGALIPAVERPVAYLDHVTPAADSGGSGTVAPPSRQRSALMPHTDRSARGNPPDYLALACVRNDAERGGESVLVPFEPIARRLRRTAPRTYELLQDPVYPIFNEPKNDWGSTGPLLRGRRGTGPDGGPVEYHEVRFTDRGVRAGLRTMTPPSPEHVEAFEELSALIHDEANWMIHRLGPGEMVVFDNARVLHGRTAIQSGAERDLKRLNGNYWPLHGPVVKSQRRLVAGR